jgi:hypothetical protein
MSDLHIPTPCHEAWDGMTPMANGRHCAACNQVVVDVTSLPVAEGRQVLAEVAQGLVTTPGRRTCVRAHANPSGRLVPGRRKLLTPALVMILASAMTGCIGDGPELVKPHTTQTEEPAVVQPTNQPLPLQGAPIRRPVPQEIAALQGDVCLSPKLGTVAPPVEPDVIKGKIVAPTQK